MCCHNSWILYLSSAFKKATQLPTSELTILFIIKQNIFLLDHKYSNRAPFFLPIFLSPALFNTERCYIKTHSGFLPYFWLSFLIGYVWGIVHVCDSAHVWLSGESTEELVRPIHLYLCSGDHTQTAGFWGVCFPRPHAMAFYSELAVFVGRDCLFLLVELRWNTTDCALSYCNSSRTHFSGSRFQISTMFIKIFLPTAQLICIACQNREGTQIFLIFFCFHFIENHEGK